MRSPRPGMRPMMPSMPKRKPRPGMRKASSRRISSAWSPSLRKSHGRRRKRSGVGVVMAVAAVTWDSDSMLQ